jgi:glycogen debranching enzyme
MNIIELEDKYYILSTSSFADSRTMVLKQGDTFGVFDTFGDMHTIGQGVQGIYHEGTRYLSEWGLSVNGERPMFLSSTLKEENEILTVDLTNPDQADAQGKMMAHGTLHIHRTRFLWNGICYERLRLANFCLEPFRLGFMLQFDADFADIFEVRGTTRKRKGKRLPEQVRPGEVVLGYLGLDEVQRNTRLAFQPEPAETQVNMARYTVSLQPKETFDITVAISFESGGQRPQVIEYAEARNELISSLRQLKRYACGLSTSNEQFNNWLNRSQADLITMVTLTEKGPYPYAGVPWYSTPFGRDGIITALECLWASPEVALGVLHYLAATQATRENDFQDAQPGKILHETRGGEMAALGEIPFKQYYGTVDATPLFVSLAGAYYERTADLAAIRQLWPNIEAALRWIDEYGDVDQDGFVEYARKAETGLANQGWKDSHDSIFHQDGTLAEGPIALCEVQGYVYEAKVRGSELAQALGHTELAQRLLRAAQTLQERFSEAFWLEEKSTFALALDGHKRPCRVSSSNAGHCLFSGIATQQQAEKVAASLLSDKLFSGWGIRTLATDEVRYNPMSYHNGTVWPHDNALIGYGMARYGLREEAMKVLSGLYDTTLFLDLQRLPELFCGFNRRKGEGPTAYPVACSPQAWAVASVFMLIQACLGLQINACTNTISFLRPALPAFLEEVLIRNLRVNADTVALRISRNDGEVTVQPLNKERRVRIEVVL